MYETLFGSKIDAYIIFNPVNRYYFTQFNSTFGCVILTKDEKIFITDSRYFVAAVIELEQKGFSVIQASGYKNLYNVINTELARLKCKSIGYEDKFLTVSEYKDFKTAFTDYKHQTASLALERMRLIKTNDEVLKIIEAQRIAERSLKKVITLIKPGITERDLATELMFECVRGGADEMSFSTIIAFGENTANPHHFPSARKFEKNDLVLIDFGVKCQGYCSDMTRTFCLNEPKEELAVIHNIVLEAQNYALKHIKAGMTANEADSLAREYIRANGYDKEFSHSLGHGVGLEIHEAPRLSMNAEDILQTGMIVTVEPGIYVTGVGGVRIEDMILIKDDGIENLTIFDKSIIL